MAEKFYRVKDWHALYENSRTRELKKMDWVPLPNHHDTDGYRSLISRVKGTSIFGAWVLILQVASRCHPRGCLLRNSGVPHTAETIARMTGADERSIRNALTVLCEKEIGWLETVDLADMEQPPAKVATAEDKKRSHQRVDRFMRSGQGVLTPLGNCTERPTSCQWCGLSPANSPTGAPAIVAHHVIGYVSYEESRAVIFVCRSCHGFFESGKYTTAMILERHGKEWMRSDGAGDSDVIAGDSAVTADACSSTAARARALEGTERKERNGTEPPAAGALILSVPEWQRDATFQPFVETFRASGAAVIDSDFQEAHKYVWKKLDPDQKHKRIAAIQERVRLKVDPVYITRVRKFIETEWERPVARSPTVGKKGFAADVERTIQERLSRGDAPW